MSEILVRFVPGAKGGCLVRPDVFDDTDTLSMPDNYETTEFGQPFDVGVGQDELRVFHAKQMMEVVRRSSVGIAPHDVVETITIYENDADKYDKLFVVVNSDNVVYVIYNNQLYRDPEKRNTRFCSFLTPARVREVILANQVF